MSRERFQVTSHRMYGENKVEVSPLMKRKLAGQYYDREVRLSRMGNEMGIRNEVIMVLLTDVEEQFDLLKYVYYEAN